MRPEASTGRLFKLQLCFLHANQFPRIAIKNQKNILFIIIIIIFHTYLFLVVLLLRSLGRSCIILPNKDAGTLCIIKCILPNWSPPRPDFVLTFIFFSQFGPPLMNVHIMAGSGGFVVFSSSTVGRVDVGMFSYNCRAFLGQLEKRGMAVLCTHDLLFVIFFMLLL